MTPALPTVFPETVRFLRTADPILGAVIDQVGPCQIEPVRRVDLFRALLRSIIYQQLHAKAASAIHARVCATMPRINAKALLSVSDEDLRAAGLSAGKLRALRDLAERAVDGTLPTPAVVKKLSDDELIERLTTIRGIGPWTAHMVMIFHLGRPDVLPLGDFAIRKAFNRLYGRNRTMTPTQMIRRAQCWQPHRSTASWYLWRSLDLP